MICLLVLFLIYKVSFNRFTGNYLLTYIFSNYSTGSYQGNVTQFSLIYGIEIESLEIRSGSNFDNQILFSCDRLAILYNLPYLFFGRLKLSEVSLTKPFLQILEKNGKFNIAELFISSETKEDKIEEPSTTEEINLYLPVSAYLNFFIEDLTFRVEKEKGESFFLTEEKNLDLKIQVNTKRFRKIPLNTSIVSIFETIHVALNPTSELQVLFEDNSTKISQGFSTSLLLDLDSTANPPLFNSRLNLGSNQIQIYERNKPLPSFGLNAFYELNYIPTDDTLDLKELTIQFDKSEWLRANGKITKAITDEREFDLQITNSDIELAPVTTIYKQISTRTNMDFRGNIKLAPISIKGKMDSLITKVDIKAKNFLFKKNTSTHSIPFLNLIGEANLDLLTKEESTKENPIPLLKFLSLKTDLSYNSLLAEINAEVDAGKKIDLFLNLKSLYLRNFISGIGGHITGKATVNGKSFSNLNVGINALCNSLDYSVQGSKSGLNNIDLSVLGDISLGEGFSFQSSNVKNLFIKVKNSENREALGLKVSGKFSLISGMDIFLEKANLTSNLNQLIPILPLSLKEKLAPIKKILGTNPNLEGNIHYKNFTDSTSIDGILKLALPGMNLNDLQSDFSLKISKNETGEINISKFSFTGLNGVLKGDVNGNLIKKTNKEKPPLGSYYPSLTASLSFNSEKQIEIVNGIKFDGKVGLNLILQDYLVKGKLESKKTSIVSSSGICKENDYTTCNLIYINEINIDLPFEHDLKVTTTKNLIEGNKIKFISTYGQTLPPNFTIRSVVGTHPYITNELFKLVQETGTIPGLTARLDYKENVFSINSLKIAILDGLIFGKDILLNIGNLNLEEMEYAATLQIKDIDLKQLLPGKSQKEIKDGKVKADLNLSGKNLKDPIANLNLFFSVFKIGEDFGKSAIRVVSSSNVITEGIISSYSQIKNIEVELSKGLIYADILFERSILSTVFIRLENNKISQERMPLANFLNRAKSEVSNYE